MSGALLPLSLGAAGVSCTRRHRRRPCVAAASTVATDAASGTDSGDDDELDLEMLDELLALRRQRDERESVQESTIGNGIARLIFENLREVRALSVAPRQGRGGRMEHRRRLPRRREVSPVSLPPLTAPAGAFRRKIGGRSERRGARGGWSGGAPLLPPGEAAKGGSLRVAVPLGDHSLPSKHLQLGAEHGQEVRLAQQLRVPAGVRHGAPRHAPSGFELLGFDVLIDAQLRPWLLEVNASPSLEGGSALDAELKSGLLRDVVHILRPLPFNRTRLAAILRRRAREGAGVGGERARAQLNADLWEVLGGDAPRRLDEAPAETGLFRPLAPSPEWNALQARSAGRQRG